jgi:hypothetical protein
VSAQLEWVHACSLLIKRNCLLKIFSVSHISVFGTGGYLIPTKLRINLQWPGLWAS